MKNLTRDEELAFEIYEWKGFDAAIEELVFKHGFAESEADDLIMSATQKKTARFDSFNEWK